MKTYKFPIRKLQANQIFVCGTNTEGRHGKGAALWARLNAGLKFGHADGLCGQTYAIVTKNLRAVSQPSISTKEIKRQIVGLYKFALDHPKLEFLIAYLGVGKNLNGYTPRQMAKLFNTLLIPSNIVFEEEFYKLIYEG